MPSPPGIMVSMPNTDLLASIAADIISDQLREQLENSEIIPRHEYDTSLTRRESDTYIVDLVQLHEGAQLRSDGDVILRVRVDVVR